MLYVNPFWFLFRRILLLLSAFGHSTQTGLGNRAAPAYERTLINISSGIGDALMAEPMIRALKTAYPAIQIHVLASPATKIIFKMHPLVQKVFVLRPHFFSILGLTGQLRKIRYGAYIGTIPSNTISQILVPYLSFIPFRVKHRTPHENSRDYDFLFQQTEPIPDGRHRIECNLDLLKHVDATPDLPDQRPHVFLSMNTVEKVKEGLRNNRFDEKKLTIGFHPGCNPQAAFKRWAPENYAKLITYLQEQWSAQIVLIGGKDEKDDVQRIESLLVQKPLNFVGQVDLLETAALIQYCRFFISNDSGIMHLSTAVDVPVFAIFGPKDERHIGPYGIKHTVIRNGKEVNNVTVEQVIDVLLHSEYGLKQGNNK